jgi:hypothetical protein
MQEMAFEERLISAVQDYKIIYDSSHTFYYDSIRRENAWTEIGETLNKSGRLIIIMQ